MAETMNSKKLLLEFLELSKTVNRGQAPIRVLRSNVFQIGKANVLVRVAADLGRKFFFGLNYLTAEEIYNLPNAFVAFVCGAVDKVIFMPAEILIRHLPDISHDRNGEYKINFTRSLSLILKGRGNQFDCSEFINNWDLLEKSIFVRQKTIDPAQSIHTVVQGRLIEIGNIRGFHTYSPDKSKQFNRQRLDELIALRDCPNLQFTEFKSLRSIDVIWFRKATNDFYPEYAFEVEISTGGWSGFGRLATLREYQTKLYVVTHDLQRFDQIRSSFSHLRERFIYVQPEQIGLLYSAEKNLIEMRKEFNL